ncbi:MAG: DoxX family protein [Bryobacteraceae bacterium]|nr:DoxX family protein [Bryobacteraceae bacterium]
MALSRILPWIVNAPLAVLIAYSAITKLAETSWWAEWFRGWGLRPYLTTIGAIELIGLLLYLAPSTMRIGLVVLAAFFGGAIATTPVAPAAGPLAAGGDLSGGTVRWGLAS